VAGKGLIKTIRTWIKLRHQTRSALPVACCCTSLSWSAGGHRLLDRWCPQYIADLISWTATVPHHESQTHREMPRDCRWAIASRTARIGSVLTADHTPWNGLRPIISLGISQLGHGRHRFHHLGNPDGTWLLRAAKGGSKLSR